MKSEEAFRSLVMFAQHAREQAERRAERAADADMIAMFAWAHMRAARFRMQQRMSLAMIQPVLPGWLHPKISLA